MISDLIVYNFQTTRVNQSKVLHHISDLLISLRDNEIQVDFLKIVDGNKLYPLARNLIGKILNYWSQGNKTLPVVCVYQSFLLLYRYLTNESTIDYGYFVKDGILLPKEEQKTIVRDLKSLVEENVQPAFFNAILITSDLYKLEAPYGIALGSIFEGGICLNANTHKNSLWHETAHLLGADDHYDENNHYKSICCSDSRNCLMQWDSLKGNSFCNNSLTEIRKKLINQNAKVQGITSG